MTQDRKDRILDAYTKLRKILQTKLEIEYKLPDLTDPERVGAHFQTVITAYGFLPELPGDPYTKMMLAEMLLSWLTAVQMQHLHARHLEAWYGDASDKQLTEFYATLAVLDFEE